MIARHLAVLALCAPSFLPAIAEAQESPLARRPGDLPHAEAGAHAGWRTGETPQLYRLALDSYRNAQDIPRTIEWLHVLLDQRADYPPATLMLGGMYFRLRRYEDSVECFERFLLHAPKEVARTRQLGHALYSLGRYEAARAHYEGLLDVGAQGLEDGARAAVLRGLGLARQKLGNLTQALEALDSAVELDPLSSPTLLARANARDEAGDVEGALADALAARAQDPFDPRPAFLAATLLDDLEREQDAGAHYEAFERLAPVDAQARDLELRLLHRPGDVEALEELARLYASIAHWSAVDHTLRRARPGSLSHAKLSATLLVTRAPGAAARAVETLRTRYGSDPEAWRAIAAYHAALGQEEEAVAAEARAAQLDRSERR